MYTRLKQEMIAAGFVASEGPELTMADHSSMRDFFYMNGKTINDYITMSGEQVAQEGTVELTEEEKQVAAQQAELDRIAAEQEAERLEAEAKAAEEKAEAERLAAEQETARVAAEAEATQAETARVAAEQNASDSGDESNQDQE